uniref:HNH/ENDO VII family nuclease n=1 Tax=Butyrivibrio sp. TaxID=28121 RepID=UPI0025FA5E63
NNVNEAWDGSDKEKLSNEENYQHKERLSLCSLSSEVWKESFSAAEKSDTQHESHFDIHSAIREVWKKTVLNENDEGITKTQKTFYSKSDLFENNDVEQKESDGVDNEKKIYSELTPEEREQIKKETGCSDEIIDYIKNMDQYEIYKNANLEEREIDGRKCLVKKDLDLDYVSEKTIDDNHPNGISNRELMKLGRSPYDAKTGERIELHHMGQDYDSPFAELCEDSEHGDGNYSDLHANDTESWRRDKDLKNQYNNQDRPNHWKERCNKE